MRTVAAFASKSRELEYGCQLLQPWSCGSHLVFVGVDGESGGERWIIADSAATAATTVAAAAGCGGSGRICFSLFKAQWNSVFSGLWLCFWCLHSLRREAQAPSYSSRERERLRSSPDWYYWYGHRASQEMNTYASGYLVVLTINFSYVGPAVPFSCFFPLALQIS